MTLNLILNHFLQMNKLDIKTLTRDNSVDIEKILVSIKMKSFCDLQT